MSMNEGHDTMTTAVQNREAMAEIRRAMHKGELTYAEAKAKAQPIIDRINVKNAEIAKKYGKRAAKVSFAAIMR